MSSGRAIALAAMFVLRGTVIVIDPPGRSNHRRVRNSTCENVLETARATVESGRKDAFAFHFARCHASGWVRDPGSPGEAVTSCLVHLLRESENPWDRGQRAYVDGHALGVIAASDVDARTQACQVTLIPISVDGQPTIALFQRRPGLMRDTREWLVEPLVTDPAASSSLAAGGAGVR